MAYIYKIINDINNKVYIGKTYLSIEERFRQHCYDAKKDNIQHRPLYKAIKKYGIEHFSITMIEQCTDEEADIRECFWIDYYNSYHNGYNATHGGEGKLLFSHQKIAQLLINNPYPSEIAKDVGCSRDLVYDVAKEYGIEVKSKGQFHNYKAVVAYDKEGHKIKTFNSISDAAKWCEEIGVCKKANGGVRSHISDVTTGKRKSAYGFHWKVLEN